MKVNGKNFKTVWMENGRVYAIDQRLLPHKFKIITLKTTDEIASSIKNMAIRGAPAIGAMAAYGMAVSALNFKGNGTNSFYEHIDKDSTLIKSTRPTAFDLFHAVDLMADKIKSQQNAESAKKIAVKAANKYAEDSSESCKKIGELGNKLIKNHSSILTHCNAGALACVDYGTALSPIRIAHYSGKNMFVYVDETRPRNQGMSLTAWELSQENIPHAIIADNAAGYFMREGKIDLVIVGADRVAMNGDVANKIGTYEKAVLAKENNIPFYVAAPLSTFDRNCITGDDIKIEERSGDEITYMQGIDENQNIKKIRIAPENSRVKNPAFDVTPSRYITGIITEKGIIKPNKDNILNFVGNLM